MNSGELNFTFAHTPRVVYGAGATRELGDILDEFGWRRAMIVTDSFLADNTDIVEKVAKALGARHAGTYSGVVPDPTADSIDRGAEEARKAEADVLVSVGGGSAIDTAKGMAVVLTEGGKVLDHEGYHALSRRLTPHVAIPTTAGTGSEMTMVLVVKDPARGQKTFIGSYYLHPDVALLDPELTVGLPARLTAATGLDALSHALESLVSMLRNPFSEACALQATRLVFENLEVAVKQPGDLTARGNMLMAAALAGTAFSNAMVSVNHALAHTVGARYGIHHGTANAIFLPHTVRFLAEAAADKFALAARWAGLAGGSEDDEKAASMLADHLEKFISDLGINDRLSDYGVKRQDLPSIADMAMTDGSIIYSPRPVTGPEDLVPMLEKAL